MKLTIKFKSIFSTIQLNDNHYYEGLNLYLNELSKHESGKIISISCSDKLKSRLSSFGITRGSNIFVMEKTLSKNTIEIKINSTKIALRNSEAKFIEIEKVTC